MSRDPYSVEEKKTAREILDYLRKNPKAKDTIEGIAGWWLRRDWGEHTIGEVERAISFLLSKDLILETQREGLPHYYGINPRKREEISRILKGS